MLSAQLRYERIEGQELKRERHTVGHEASVPPDDRRVSFNRDDGPEFSSEPVPAAYGVFISSAIGFVVFSVLCLIFWLI